MPQAQTCAWKRTASLPPLHREEFALNLVTCECGNKIGVTAASEGREVTCTCGRTFIAPSFRDYRVGLVPLENCGRTDSESQQVPDAASAPRCYEFDAATADEDAEAAAEKHALRSMARQNLIIGGVVCLVGLVITIYSFARATSSGGGSYLIAWGAIIFGAIQFFRGLAQMSRS